MDHERVGITNTAMSCGIFELNRISEDTEAVAYSLASRLYHPSRGNPVAFFIWSDLSQRTPTSADKLKSFLEEKSFAKVEVSNAAENPRTGNWIVIYVARINHQTFKHWYSERRIERAARAGT